MRLGKQVPFDTSSIAKLRQDFLLLMKQVHKPTDYDEAAHLQKAFTTWRLHFEGIVLRITKLLEQSLWKAWKDGPKKRDIETLTKMINGDTWGLVTLDFPLRHPDAYWNKELCFKDFIRKLPAWESRLRRDSRPAWKVLKDFIFWYQKLEETDEPVRLNFPDSYTDSIEGFSITFKAINERDKKELNSFQVGLRRYKQRATQILPWLLRYKLPIILEGFNEGGLDFGGRYERDHVLINTIQNSDPDKVAYTLAHEMGHHLWRTGLDSKAHTYWRDAILGDSGPVDLSRLFRGMKDGDTVADYILRLDKHLDPLWYLQLMGLMYSSQWHQWVEDHGKVDVKTMLDSGTDEIHVPKHPISAYAGKNPEEAFCDALGQLVGYGPRTVPEMAREWLKVVVPSIRVASLQEKPMRTLTAAHKALFGGEVDRQFVAMVVGDPELYRATRDVVIKAAAWDNLPKGWTQESVEKFWDSLTGDAKHKVTKCMKEMEGKIDNTGAFCGSLADKIEGSTDWRKKSKKAGQMDWKTQDGAMDKIKGEAMRVLIRNGAKTIRTGMNSIGFALDGVSYSVIFNWRGDKLQGQVLRYDRAGGVAMTSESVFDYVDPQHAVHTILHAKGWRGQAVMPMKRMASLSADDYKTELGI